MNKEKIKEQFEHMLHNKKLMRGLSIASMSVVCFFIMVFVISVMPSIASETSVEVPLYVPTTVEETMLEESTQEETSEAESETLPVIDKTKFKVDKTATAHAATGNDKVDEDKGAHKAQDSSTSENNAPVVTITPTTVIEPEEVVAEVSDFTYVSRTGLSGLYKINSNIFNFNDAGELIKGHQIINGKRYYFNDYGANASKFGIDVSKHQGAIDWGKVKAAGIDYAIIRIAYRGYGSKPGKDGIINKDVCFEENLAGAKAAGIAVGVYFYSQAKNQDEAVQEASTVINELKGRSLQYPVYFDTEYSGSTDSNGNRDGRADNISKSTRTACAIAFCETIRSAGYKAGVYASKSFFDDELIFSSISGYEIWVAHYTSGVTNFKHPYRTWQYSSSGSVDGISGKTDINISLYDYAKGSSMSSLGNEVIFLNSTDEVRTYEDAEKAVALCISEYSQQNYDVALSKVNALGEERVRNALAKKLDAVQAQHSA